jgi:hypothetical protein
MRKVTGFVVGIIIGAALAAAGLWMGARDGSSDTAAERQAAETTSTTVPVAARADEPAWTEEGGVRFESTVVIVDGLDVEGSSAVLDYRLVALGGSPAFFFGGSSIPAVLPETWELHTAGGMIVDATSDPPRPSELSNPDPQQGVADSIRFEAETDLDTVTAVTITGWRVAVPSDVVAEMPGVDGASAQLYDGTVMKIGAILEQRTGAIINFDLDRPADPWQVTVDRAFGPSSQFVGDGPGWKRAASTSAGIGFTGSASGFQLTWSEPTPPETVRVRARLVAWEPLDDTVTVWSDS